MRFYLLAAATCAFGLTSCLNTGPDTCSSTMITPILSATGPKTVAVNSPAVYNVVYQAANGCGTLANIPAQITGNSQVISLNVTYNSCSCSTAAVPAQTTYTFQPTQAGTYYLQFVANTGYLTDTLVVK